MGMTTLPEDQRLANISSKAYEHPADRAATAALAQVPLLDVVVRKLIEFGFERAYRQNYLAASIKLGEHQVPPVWADWNAVCTRLDLPERYDLYLTQMPLTNAAAIGAGTPMVVVTSRSLDLFDELELRTVLGHEAGHILSDHVMYITALMILMDLSGRMPLLAGLPLQAAKLVLLEWFRAAELSADRAATLVNRDPLITCRTLMVMSGGVRAERLDLDAFIRQAGDYQDWDSKWDRFSRLRTELRLTHSHPVKRVKEVMAWVQSGEYDRIVAGEYPTRDQQADARKEAGAAYDHYVARFKAVFRDFGVDKVQDKASDAASRISDWLRNDKQD